MTSTDDSTSISSMMIESDASQDPLNNAPTPSETGELRQTVENYEDNEQDEESMMNLNLMMTRYK